MVTSATTGPTGETNDGLPSHSLTKRSPLALFKKKPIPVPDPLRLLELKLLPPLKKFSLALKTKTLPIQKFIKPVSVFLKIGLIKTLPFLG